MEQLLQSSDLVLGVALGIMLTSAVFSVVVVGVVELMDRYSNEKL